MTRAISSLVLIAASLAAQSDPLVSGLEAFSKGDYAAAERFLSEAAKQGKDARASTFLALTLAVTGRCEAADAGLRKALTSADPKVERLAGLALAQCDLTLNKLDDAAAVLAKLKLKYPADADVLYQTARLQMRAWNDTIYQLYQRNPSSFRVNQISGEIFETQGKFPEAAAEYRKAIGKNPKALNLHFRLGRALLLGSHSPEALEAARQEFEAELVLNPSDAVAEYQVAQVLLAQNKPADGAARLEKALHLKPDFPEALIALGKVRLDTKKNDEAIFASAARGQTDAGKRGCPLQPDDGLPELRRHGRCKARESGTRQAAEGPGG